MNADRDFADAQSLQVMPDVIFMNINNHQSNHTDKEKKPYGKLILLPILFGSFIFFTLLYLSYSDQRDLDKFLSSLRRLENIKIKINDEFHPNKNEIIYELLKTRNLSAHHSHPTDKIKIEIITNKDIIKIELGRDSENKNEYYYI